MRPAPTTAIPTWSCFIRCPSPDVAATPLAAPAPRGGPLVVAADVLERMEALVGADGDVACRGCHGGHAGEVVRLHRLLEEIEPGIGDRAHVLHGLLRAPALIGVG